MDDTEKEHLKWLEKRAKDARRRLEGKMAERNKLIDEVTKLARDTTALEQAMSAIRQSLGLHIPDPGSARFSNMTIKQAAEIVMREHGDEMKTTEIVKALNEGGKELGDRGYSAVVTTLLRGDQFEKVGKGVFRLNES